MTGIYEFARNLLFRLDPETSHDWSLGFLKGLAYTPLIHLLRGKRVSDPLKVMGIEFPNRVGLAAGLDKNGDYINAMAALGFGFVEIGTVTPRPQPGNPQPRLFRLPEAEAIINRMGFNNLGVEHLIEQVKRAEFKGVLGINIGKNFDTPVENAIDDYLYCMEEVFDFASYITVNISSPNTPGLRELQFGEHLHQLLATLKTRQEELAESHGHYVPLAVKIAPDLSDEEIRELAAAFLEHRIDGVIATNTTSDRDQVEGMPHGEEQGGLSGKPVFEKSTRVLAQLVEALGGAIPVIGVGGIASAEDARAKIAAGAALVQIYSGFIYQGPALISDCANALKAVSPAPAQQKDTSAG